MILHTGGAIGADYYFSKFATQFGIDVEHHSFNGHNNKIDYGKTILHNNIDLNKYQDRLSDVCKFLKLYSPHKDYIRNLLLRDMIQSDKSEVVYAVGMIENGWVKGGTKYCVTRAYLDNKPIYFYEQDKSKCWFKINKSEGDMTFLPIGMISNEFPQSFAGVGTREINQDGIDAIEKLFKGGYV